MLQWISLVGFPRLNSSASIPRVLCFSFLPSFRPSVRPSLLQVVMTLSSVHVGWLAQKKSPVPAVTVRFLRSRCLARISIRANWLSLVRDLSTLHMVLEAAIPVSRFRSTGQARPCARASKVRVRCVHYIHKSFDIFHIFKYLDTLHLFCSLHSSVKKVF